MAGCLKAVASTGCLSRVLGVGHIFDGPLRLPSESSKERYEASSGSNICLRMPVAVFVP